MGPYPDRSDQELCRGTGRNFLHPGPGCLRRYIGGHRGGVPGNRPCPIALGNTAIGSGRGHRAVRCHDQGHGAFVRMAGHPFSGHTHLGLCHGVVPLGTRSLYLSPVLGGAVFSSGHHAGLFPLGDQYVRFREVSGYGLSVL